MATALEIVDVDADASMQQAVTGDVYHRAVVIGSASSTPPRSPTRASLLVDGSIHAAETVVADPGRTVRQIALLLDVFNHRLLAGDTIIGGSLIHQPIDTGHEITAVIYDLPPTPPRVIG